MAQTGFGKITSFLLSVIFSCAAYASAPQDLDQLLDEIVNETENDSGNEQVELAVQPALVEIHGVVSLQRKYSVVVQSGQERLEIKLPIGVPIQRELIRPKFDFENSTIKMTLPCTGEGGDQSKNEQVELPLPNPLAIRAIFQHETAKEAFLAGENKRLAKYSLGPDKRRIDRPNEISGTLVQESEKYMIETEYGTKQVVLGAKTNLLAGYSISALVPDTEVSIQVLEIDGQLVAQDVRFQVSTKRPQTDMPKLLSLGDMVSFSYQRALHDQFADQFSIYHPPANCGGSDNWNRLNRWLGDYTSEPWDVVLFNCGLVDNSMSKERYQSNLEKWIERIEPATSQIVWLTNTPIQGIDDSVPANQQLVGRLPGRMKLQNQWAAEVFAKHPDIKICDLWQLVKDGEEADFAHWWKSDRAQFNYSQSKILAAAIAEVISQED